MYLLVDAVPKLPSHSSSNAIALPETPSNNMASFCQLSLGLKLGEGFADGASCPLKPIAVGVDFLTGIIAVNGLQDVLAVAQTVSAAFNDHHALEPGQPAYHGKHYQNSGRSVKGALYCWSEPGENSPVGELWLSLPGRLWSSIDFDAACSLSQQLADFGFRSTRLDFCLDDYRRRIVPFDLLPIAEAGNFARAEYFGVAGGITRRPDWVDKDGSPTLIHHEYSKSVTLYFGSPKSDKRLRVYDKNIESKGLIDAVRFEVQFRANQAEINFIDFINSLQIDKDLAWQLLASRVIGAVDFVDRSTSDRLDESEFLPWWQSLIEESAIPTRACINRPDPSLYKTLLWSNRQLATTFAVIKDSLGDKFDCFIDSLVDKGRHRYKPIHYAMIEQANKDFKVQ